jgi:hypothetical protein
VPQETGPWLIVDESGTTVWADETGGYFSVAYAATRDPSYFENCEVSAATSPASRPTTIASAPTCGSA